MAGINKVILVGHLGKDPEVRFTAAGKAVASVTLATSEAWTDRNTGEKQERTEWHNLTFFSPLAEIVEKYLKKGSLVYVEGALKTDKYTDKQGVERYSTKVNVNNMQMLGGRGENAGGSAPSMPNSSPNTGSNNNAYDPASFDQSDDDLPF